MSRVLKSYLKHELAIKRYLSRFFSSQQDVDDIAHEAFIRAFATEIRTEVRYPRRLLFRAAKHAALNELDKKINATTDYLEDLPDKPVVIDRSEASAEEKADARRKLAVLSMAIAELPPMCQKVFVLRKVEGLPVKEVAARLKISVSAVEKHGAAGIVKCARILRERGYEPAEFSAPKARRKTKDQNASPGDVEAISDDQ